ncbi:MAG TPA: cytochrome c biogenesis CcdA family protein [Steroidobacteraceae bacterium]
MSFGIVTFSLAFAAGMLSTLSPCVLPLIPVVVASANDTHRGGIWALGAGLAITFSVLGLFLATIGATIGLDAETFRMVGAVVLALFGILLVSPQLQGRFAVATAGAGQFGHSLLAKVKTDGLKGQFIVGSLLGLVWSPCVGPTLGAATTLASQGRSLAPIALMMLLFGLGAATPLVALGSLSRASLQRVRGRLISSGQRGRQLLGILMLLISVLIFTKLDKALESWFLDHLPAWFTELSVRL